MKKFKTNINDYLIVAGIYIVTISSSLFAVTH